MTKTNWNQRLDEAKRAFKRFTRAAQDGPTHQKGSTNIRVAFRRNVKVVTNIGQPQSTTSAIAQQVAPIRQEHRAGSPDDGSTRGAREGGDAAHESGRA
jgi:hypothetical protein